MCLIALSSFPVCFGKYRKPVKYPTMYFNCNPLFVFAKFDTHNKTKRLQGTRREGENMTMARICYFRDKCVLFARNCKFANSYHYNRQYKPSNSANLAQETLFFGEGPFFCCPALATSQYQIWPSFSAPEVT